VGERTRIAELTITRIVPPSRCPFDH